jgi:ATP-dependent exoDNAse (exonuclease V) beta subunit
LAGLPERLRPDLLVEHPDGWWVVDYKTGAEKPEHLQQVNAYAEALRLAGQSVKGRALVYLSDSDIRILENW